MPHQSEPIKILQLSSQTGMYGAERWIIALVKHLNPKKIESIVGVIKDNPDQDAPLCTKAAELGLRTKLFEAPGKINLSVIWQLRQYILQEKISIIHTHLYKTDILGFLASIGTECKIISTPHGWSKNMDFKLWCYETLDRLIFPFLNAVVPLSEDIYHPLTKIMGLKKKVHFIQNGVDLSEVIYSKAINSEILEKKKNGQFILGYIGRLIPSKGLETLLKSIEKLQNPNLELFLIGDGPFRQDLKELSEKLGLTDKIHFLGFRDDRLEFLRGFDTFILPSRTEGIPRCLMEAMAAKIPIIASNIPGCIDLITDNETGLLFEVDNHEILAEKIKKISSESALTSILSENAYNFVNKNFSAAHMTREYEILFLNLLSSDQIK